MRITIAGAQKINLKALFGSKAVTIKAVSGDFSIVEYPFKNNTTEYTVRTSQQSITSFSIVSQSGGVLVLKVLNVDAEKIRFKERVQFINTDSEVIGYGELNEITAVTGADALTHKNIHLLFGTTAESDTTSDGKFLLGTFALTDSIVLFADTVLEEGESTKPLSTNEFNSVYVSGTGIIEVSTLKEEKKKVN